MIFVSKRKWSIRLQQNQIQSICKCTLWSGRKAVGREKQKRNWKRWFSKNKQVRMRLLWRMKRSLHSERQNALVKWFFIEFKWRFKFWGFDITKHGMVDEVFPSGQAAKLGVRTGWVITDINGVSFSLKAFNAINKKSCKKNRVIVFRKSSKVTILIFYSINLRAVGEFAGISRTLNRKP